MCASSRTALAVISMKDQRALLDSLALSFSFFLYYGSHWTRCAIDDDPTCDEPRLFLSSFVEGSSETAAPVAVGGTLFFSQFLGHLLNIPWPYRRKVDSAWPIGFAVAAAVAAVVAAVPTFDRGVRLGGGGVALSLLVLALTLWQRARLVDRLSILFIYLYLSFPTLKGDAYMFLHMLPLQSGIIWIAIRLGVFSWYVLNGKYRFWPTLAARVAHVIAVSSMLAAGLGAWKVVETTKFYSVITQTVGLTMLFAISLVLANSK